MTEQEQRFARINEAYELALDGREADAVDIFDLLPAIEAAVPDTCGGEIVDALRWGADRTSKEADALKWYRNAIDIFDLLPAIEAAALVERMREEALAEQSGLMALMAADESGPAAIHLRRAVNRMQVLLAELDAVARHLKRAAEAA